MKRLVNSLGIFIALLAITSPAQAGSYSFVIGGHRFHVQVARSCRSTSCVSISSSRGIRPTEDAAPVPPSAPAPIQAAPSACPAAPVRPPQATVVVAPPPSPAPVVAATTSQPVVLPPAPRLEPPRIDPPRMDPSVITPRLETRPEIRPEIKQSITISQRNDDEPADAPLGQWESAGAKGKVRIEHCGPALCGYALTEASAKGESVLVNMKPKSDGVWTGNIYSHSSGNTYYATMTLKDSGKLHVEACVLGHFFCSGNDWRRVEDRRERLITTSRQWSGARS
jgi:uncharacterized protein DUF2147